MNHHAFAAHFCGAAWLATGAAVWAHGAGYDWLTIMGLCVLGAFALGALAELSQLVIGWGVHAFSDMLITTAGGVAGGGMAFLVMETFA